MLCVTTPRRRPAPVPAFRRCEIVCRSGGHFAGRYRSPWVVASPSAFGLLPSQPRRRREGDNCPETQHLSGPVVQGAREGGPGAAALTPQRPGMRAGARRVLACPGVPAGDAASLRWGAAPRLHSPPWGCGSVEFPPQPCHLLSVMLSHSYSCSWAPASSVYWK